MGDRGIGRAIEAWLDLLYQPPVWLAALVLAVWGVILGALLGNYLPGSGSDAATFGLISGIGNIVGFVVGVLCHFYMSTTLGGRSRTKSVIWKWIALELATAMVAATIIWLIPVTLGQTGFSRTAVVIVAVPIAMLALRALLLPLEVRKVAAIHSGNRHNTGEILRFLFADPGAWLGGALLLGIGFAVVAFVANGAVGAVPGLPMAAGLAVSRGVGGVIQATGFAFVIAAYRALDLGEEHEAEVFA